MTGIIHLPTPHVVLTLFCDRCGKSFETSKLVSTCWECLYARARQRWLLGPGA